MSWFACQCLILSLLFGILLYGYGLNAAEKKQIQEMIGGLLPV
jgi:hypothetical protein